MLEKHLAGLVKDFSYAATQCSTEVDLITSVFLPAVSDASTSRVCKIQYKMIHSSLTHKVFLSQELPIGV